MQNAQKHSLNELEIQRIRTYL